MNSSATAETYRNLLVERRGPVALVTISRPDKHNALNRETLGEIEAVFTALSSDTSVRAVVVTGAGEKAFVSGADINELSVLDARGAREASAYGQRVFDRVAGFPQPVIAAVNGWALGGGCELALACHIRYAAETARFGLPEVSLGIVPGYGGTQRLARLVGLGRAIEMVAAGKPIDAAEAHRIGLVNRVVALADVVNESVALGERIAANGPLAVSAALEAMVNGQSLSLDAALTLESTLFGILGASEDMHDGLKAFLEKRKPNFQGR